MQRLANYLYRFIRNLRRRRVPRVVAGYLITSVAAINIADVMSAIFELPEWTMRFVVTMLVVGFPIAVVLSWAFDVTPEGIRRAPAEADQGPRLVTPTQHRRKTAVTVGMTLAAVAIGVVTAARFRRDDALFRPADVVAIVPVLDQASDQRRSLSAVASMLLRTRLGSLGWETVDSRTVSGALQLQREAAQVARSVGARMYVEVQLLTHGDSAVVRTGLYEVADPQNPIRVADAEGSLRNVLQLVDVLAVQLAGWAGESPRRTNRIALLPTQFEGPAEFDYLAEGVPTLLATQLERGGFLATDNRSFFGVVKRHGNLADAAGVVGANFLLLTRIEFDEQTRSGGFVGSQGWPRQVHLSADLYHVSDTGTPVLAQLVDGDITRMPDLVSNVVSRLLQVADPGEGGSSLAAQSPTDSLAALRAFVEGERHFREGRFFEAATAFEKAINIDPEFALAYYRLAIAAEWLSDISDYNEWKRDGIELAIANGARLTWRHRLLAETRLAYEKGAVAEAERLYRWILDYYPDDYEANFQLAEILFHQAPLDGRSALGSEERWQQILTFEPDDFGALMHYARLLSLSGRLAELEAVAARALELSPNGERVLELDAIRAFAAADEDGIQRTLAALQETESARTIWTIAARVALYAKKLPGAQRIAALLTDAGRPAKVRLLGHVTIAHLQIAQGHLRRAHAELQAASALDPLSGIVFDVSLSMAPFAPKPRQPRLEAMRDRLIDLQPMAPERAPVTELTVHDSVSSRLRLYALGLLSLELRSENDVNSYVGQLEGLGGSADAATLGRELGLSLRIESYRVKGLFTAAVRQWDSFAVRTASGKNQLSPFFALTRERFVRALLLRETDRQDEAIRLFASFDELSVYDLAYLGPASYQRGELLESKADYASAAAEYRRLVDLWRDPDPELAWMVENARERLEALAGLGE